MPSRRNTQQGRVPTAEDIARLYEMFLAREPESVDAIENKRERGWPDVVEEFLASEEYETRTASRVASEILRRVAAFEVADGASRDDLQALLERVQTSWQSMGSSDDTVYRSVLTDEPWSEPLDSVAVERFYTEAADETDSLLNLVSGVQPDFRIDRARVLDFGCGVGRMLLHFAERAAWSEGWDLSETHLERLSANFSELFAVSPDRYGVRLLDRLDIAAPVPGFDLILSVLVLQHNPPPLMKHMLREILRSLKPKGVALLHIPTAPLSSGYSFSLPEDWSLPHPVMEMHALSKDAIYRVVAEEGATIRLSRYWEKCAPDFLSELFVIVK